MALNYKNIQIDKELEDLLPPLSKEDYNILESSLVRNGFQEQFGKIKVWFPDGGKQVEKSIGYIVDGHNRYRICKKNNIDLPYWCYEFVFFDSKEEVLKWMYENQIARRNLSEVDKYEIVEKYSRLLNEMAKKNQSDGGKGLSNLTKVNVRKEKANKVGISEGSYHKLDKVMKSDNEKVKEQLKNKKISIDKAYQTIKEFTTKKNEDITPQQRIEKLDNRMGEIDKEISALRIEREALMRKRTSIFENLDITCEVKYEFVSGKYIGRDCRFYIEIEGHKEILLECGVYCDETPDAIWLRKIPDKYKNDVIMLWKRAHYEDVEYNNRRSTEWSKNFEKAFGVSEHSEENKDFYKKCFRILAKNFHPDNSDGNMDDMKNLNKLKLMWGV